MVDSVICYYLWNPPPLLHNDLPYGFIVIEIGQ
jgi:hypothetical protein